MLNVTRIIKHDLPIHHKYVSILCLLEMPIYLWADKWQNREKYPKPHLVIRGRKRLNHFQSVMKQKFCMSACKLLSFRLTNGWINWNDLHDHYISKSRKEFNLSKQMNGKNEVTAQVVSAPDRFGFRLVDISSG